MTVAEKEKEKQELLESRKYWWWAEKARSPRINYLRKALWAKTTKGSAYLPGVKVDPIMVKIAAEHLAKPFEVVGEPFMKVWAKILAENFDTAPIFIIDQSQIVGYVGSRPNELKWLPLGSYDINSDIYNDRTGVIEEEDRPWIKEALEIIKPWTLQSLTEKIMPRKERINCKLGITYAGAYHNTMETYTCPQPDWYLKGFNYIIEQIDKNIAKAREEDEALAPNFDRDMENVEKIQTWEAMKLSLQAVIRWARRYSRLAKIVAENFETDPQRKQELLRISETCRKVPAEAPEQLWEAIQFEMFKSLADRHEQNGRAWPFRVDQTLYPYYKRSVEEDKTLTKEEALDYCCEMHLRAYEYSSARVRVWREMMTGDIGPWVWTIGGQDKDGKDACNDLSDLIMETARLCRVTSPTLTFRYHKNARLQTLRKVHECLTHGLGYPNIRNDEPIMSGLQFWSDATLEEARTYVIQGCIVPCPPSKRAAQPLSYANSSTLGSKALELALHNGFDPVSGMQIGPKTGDPLDFKTYEDLYNATLEQLKVFHWEAFRTRHYSRFIEQKVHGRPLMSAYLERCVEEGKNHALSKELGNPWVSLFAWMDQMDALAAMKKLVYEENKYTMKQVLEMLKANWEGYAMQRMDFVKAPKWGNDDDYVDEIVARMHRDLRDKVCLPTREYSGKPWSTAPQNISAYVVAATKIGPLPNGRRLGDTLYDGGCSPGAGLDKKGPTAVLRSVSKIDHATSFKANLLNQRLSPTQMVGEKGFELWHNYIKTWAQLGINNLQLNMVDNETLFAAQKEPEKYSEVMVRVAGYSACFVELNTKTQDTIIARTVQTL